MSQADDEALETIGRFSRRSGIPISHLVAQLTLESHDGVQVFDCRPSDALNIALRAGAPIAVGQAILDDAGVD